MFVVSHVERDSWYDPYSVIDGFAITQESAESWCEEQKGKLWRVFYTLTEVQPLEWSKSIEPINTQVDEKRLRWEELLNKPFIPKGEE